MVFPLTKMHTCSHPTCDPLDPFRRFSKPSIGIAKDDLSWRRSPLQGNHRWKGSANEEPAVCPKCSRVYRRRKHMLCHLRDECGKPPQFHCPYCIKATRQKSNLRSHIRTKHPGQPRRHTDFFFVSDWQTWRDPSVEPPSSSDTLERHRCPRCHKDYRRRHHMLYHLRMECGKPPQFLCPYCNHATKQKSNLRTHIRRQHIRLLNNDQSIV
ncbi:RE1-silencing transcription factor A [Frankliniella fusca]|uniref:RE1-silencing transcription factor A n=1 Tax=Frankliniella fusca TaxID=407009 RepID=A0AAE1H606_9NEOP|nr:RE1-silencing transcription factor A [Frankliniella fusca]